MRSKNSGRTVAGLAIGVVAVGFMVGPVHAQPTPIFIPNAGFEDRETFDPFDEGVDKYNQWGSEAWRHFEVDNNGGPLRIWNPGDPEDPPLEPQGIADVGFEGEAPEGKYVVVVRSRYNDDEFHDPPQVRDFEAAVQILTETFDPTMTYTLSAEVGQLPGSDYYNPLWYGYSLQLAVGGVNVDGARYAGRVDGGTVIAEDYDSQEVPVDDFVTATVTYTPDPEHADLAGLPLQIRLAALEDPDDHSLTTWVAFDDVRLTAEPTEPTEPSFVRGDADADGEINITDGIFILNFLFLGGEDPSCMDAADADDSEDINITDGIYVLNFLFLGGPSPTDPWPDCGPDPDDGGALSCGTEHPGCVQ
jgi:hypothetical protein